MLLGRNGRAAINLLKHGPKSVDLPRRANGNEGQLTNILDAYIIGVHRLTKVLARKEPGRIVVDQHNVLPAIWVHRWQIPGR